MSKRLAITAVLPHRALVSVPRLPALLLALCGGFAIAQAATLSGFESGLAGWVHSGDVSIHSAAIGLVPTEGQQLAFLSNMDFRHNPYSGKPANYATRGLLGMPDDTNDFLALMPPVALGINPLPFGSAATLRFIAPGMGQLAFDWAKLGADTDFAFLSLWSDDGAYRFNDWIYAGPLPTALGGVRLCQRIFENSTPPRRLRPRLLRLQHGHRVAHRNAARAAGRRIHDRFCHWVDPGRRHAHHPCAGQCAVPGTASTGDARVVADRFDAAGPGTAQRCRSRSVKAAFQNATRGRLAVPVRAQRTQDA